MSVFVYWFIGVLIFYKVSFQVADFINQISISASILMSVIFVITIYNTSKIYTINLFNCLNKHYKNLTYALLKATIKCFVISSIFYLVVSILIIYAFSNDFFVSVFSSSFYPNNDTLISLIVLIPLIIHYLTILSGVFITNKSNKSQHSDFDETINIKQNTASNKLRYGNLSNLSHANLSKLKEVLIDFTKYYDSASYYSNLFTDSLGLFLLPVFATGLYIEFVRGPSQTTFILSIFLIIFATFFAYYSFQNILQRTKQIIKPCLIFTDVYFINITLGNKIEYAYIWDISKFAIWQSKEHIFIDFEVGLKKFSCKRPRPSDFWEPSPINYAKKECDRLNSLINSRKSIPDFQVWLKEKAFLDEII